MHSCITAVTEAWWAVTLLRTLYEPLNAEVSHTGVQHIDGHADAHRSAAFFWYPVYLAKIWTDIRSRYWIGAFLKETNRNHPIQRVFQQSAASFGKATMRTNGSHCLKWDRNMKRDIFHPGQILLELLPSGRRFRSMRAGTRPTGFHSSNLQ